MAVRREQIKARKDKILGITINQYIKTVTPVSSGFIAREYPLQLSPATIRNILAQLEDEGYLTHPHTSAGRVPTQNGYRYYVDHLMREIQLLEDEKTRIKSEYQRQRLELEQLLEKTSEVLANTTHYTSIVSVDGRGNKIFCRGTNYVIHYPEYSDLKKIGKILTALDEKESLLEFLNQELAQKVNIFIGQEIKHRDINSCSLVVSRYETKHGASGRIAVLGPTRMNYERVVSTVDYLTQLMTELL